MSVLYQSGGKIVGAGASAYTQSTFTPLQHFNMESFSIGSTPVVTGGVGGDQLFCSFGLGYGSIISTAQHRSSKTRSLLLSIQAGTSGNPGDGETPAGNGLWGFFMAPPVASTSYGGQGSIFHMGLWMFIPNGVFLGATSLTDDALKMFRLGLANTAQKDDTHHCENFQGMAFLNEYDPNSSLNNNYPSSRSPTNSPMNAAVPKGQWAWLELMELLQSNGDSSVKRFWINDILAVQRSGRVYTWQDSTSTYHTYTPNPSTPGCPTLDTSIDTLTFIDFLTYWNSHPSVDTTIYVDDIITSIDESSMIYRDNFGNPIIGSLAS